MGGKRFIQVVLLSLLAVLSYKLWLGNDGYLEVRRLEKDLVQQRAEVESKQTRNRELEAEVKDLKDGVEAVEERARTELGMTKADETFVQILEEDE